MESDIRSAYAVERRTESAYPVGDGDLEGVVGGSLGFVWSGERKRGRERAASGI